MPVVSAKHLQKAYGPSVVLRDAEVTVRSGERVGVVGRNGAGKSTLARILAGVEAADQGTVSRRRGARILYLAQDPRFEGDPTAEEAVMSGLEAWSEAVERHTAITARLAEGGGDIEQLVSEQQEVAEAIERLGGFDRNHEVRSILDRLGIAHPGTRVSTLSGGEQRRVALARVLVARPDLAVLDEPTNHLDAETIEWLEQHWINETQGALLLITHDRYLLDRVATRTLEVSDGEVYSYDGGYGLYLEQKAERLAHAARTERNRQNLLRRELEWLRRQPKARTTKNKARMQRAEATLAADAPREERGLSLSLDLARTGKTILEARDLRIDVAGRTLVEGLTFSLTQGERVGIIGKNGCGKTTLLRTLLGERTPDGGTASLGQNTRVAYFDQHRSGLDDEATVQSSVIGDQTRITLGGQPIEPHAYLERFGLEGARARQRIGSLSGGERARVALARLLRTPSNLVVMDEPTNDLDVSTLSALEELLIEFGATALVVTHDRWFLDRVATAILAFEPQGQVVRYPGNYETFVRLKAQARENAVAEAPKAPASKPPRPQPNKKRGLSYSEKRELEGLPDAIERAEARVAALTEDLARPETYAAGGEEVVRLSGELEAARAEVERLTLRWEELEQKLAG